MADQTPQPTPSDNSTNQQYPPFQTQTGSAFKPTPLRSTFTPTHGIHNPADLITNKLDQLLLHNITTDSNFDKIRDELGTIRTQVETVSILKQDNVKIKQHLAVALGKINRLEQQKEDQHQKLIDIEQYSFSKDIVLYNLEESNPESTTDLTNKIYNLFHTSMQIPYGQYIPST